MKRVTDKNGIELEEGMSVIMPEPKGGDMWNFGDFTATILQIDIEDSTITVEDMDGDCWVVEGERVEIED